MFCADMIVVEPIVGALSPVPFPQSSALRTLEASQLATCPLHKGLMVITAKHKLSLALLLSKTHHPSNPELSCRSRTLSQSRRWDFALALFSRLPPPSFNGRPGREVKHDPITWVGIHLFQHDRGCLVANQRTCSPQVSVASLGGFLFVTGDDGRISSLNIFSTFNDSIFISWPF